MMETETPLTRDNFHPHWALPSKIRMDKLVDNLSARVTALEDEEVIEDPESEQEEEEEVRLRDPLRRKDREAAQKRKKKAGDLAPEQLESGRLSTQSERAAGTVMQERRQRRRKEEMMCGECKHKGHTKATCPLLEDQRAALREMAKIHGSRRSGSRRSKGARVAELGTQVSTIQSISIL